MAGRTPSRGSDGPSPGSPADQHVDADPEQVARTILLRRLTAAPRTRAELAGDLARRGVPDDTAERVLDRFEEVGLVDDGQYAQMWVRSRHVGRGLGRRALAAELHRKGVDPYTAGRALAEVSDDDERARAVELVRRRLASVARLDRTAAARRLIGMLARRGYSHGLAAAVVAEALRDRAELDDDAEPLEAPDPFE
jgi:regulatory protein